MQKQHNNTEASAGLNRAQRDCAWASGREYHKAAMIGERATDEQIRLWQSLGILHKNSIIKTVMQ